MVSQKYLKALLVLRENNWCYNCTGNLFILTKKKKLNFIQYEL